MVATVAMVAMVATVATDATSAICGNAVVEEGEECDCGWEDECTEQCCHPQVSVGGEGTPCTLRKDARCR